MIMRSASFLFACLGILATTATPGFATSLRIAPIIVEVPRGAATTVNIENVGREQADVQLRVFRWRQHNGKETLEPTRDVVASPPFAKIIPGARNIVRLVRISGQPITGEESYRLLIDEIPKREKSNHFKVGFAVRYSVPVFFGTAKTASNPLQWSYTQRNGRTYLTATNLGQRRVRLSEMNLANGARSIASFGKGLAGYVLGGSSMTWQTKTSLPVSDKLTVTATTEHGKITGEAKNRAAQ